MSDHQPLGPRNQNPQPAGGNPGPGGQPPNVTHFEPQRASVRAGRLVIPCKSGPHASALRLKIYKVSAIWQPPAGNGARPQLDRGGKSDKDDKPEKFEKAEKPRRGNK